MRNYKIRRKDHILSIDTYVLRGLKVKDYLNMKTRHSNEKYIYVSNGSKTIFCQNKVGILVGNDSTSLHWFHKKPLIFFPSTSLCIYTVGSLSSSNLQCYLDIPSLTKSLLVVTV